MRENKAKTKLRNGEPILGVISPMPDPIIAETIGLIGFDYYMIDGEHGAINPAQAEQIVRACETVGITPLARVRSNDPKLMLQFLDAGVMGVMMPGLMTASDVESFVAAVKYPPLGERGLGPVRAADYMIGSMSQADYVAFANDQTLVLPQFEDIRALPRLPEMTGVKGIDGFVIGPRDLAMSMGFTDGPNHPEVQKVIEQVFDIVISAGLVVGTVAGTGEAAKGSIQRGVKICLNSVQGLLASSGKTFLKMARS
jgi:4-hydroxy-2-oxoheptanedioate aldolase